MVSLTGLGYRAIIENRVSILDSILYSCEDREWSIKLLLNGTVTNSNSIRNSRRRTGQWMCLHSTFFLFINFFSLRKQPKLARNLSMPPLISPRNDILRNECRNPILMTCNYPDMGKASDWPRHGEKFASTNQRHYQDLGNDTSSKWNFCALSSDVISLGSQRWRREMTAVFSG